MVKTTSSLTAYVAVMYLSQFPGFAVLLELYVITGGLKDTQDSTHLATSCESVSISKQSFKKKKNTRGE